VFDLGDGSTPYEIAINLDRFQVIIVTPGFNFTPCNLQRAPFPSYFATWMLQLIIRGMLQQSFRRGS
jgi:hypothetical protein